MDKPMKRLGMHFEPPVEEIEITVEKAVSKLKLGGSGFDRNAYRKAVEKEMGIRRIKPLTSGETGFVCSDSSFSARAFRYFALWGMHCASVYCLHDGGENEDPLAGQSPIPYADVRYGSKVDVGSFDGRWMLEQQMNAIRIGREYSETSLNYARLAGEGVRLDYALVDGSLKTNGESLMHAKNSGQVESALKAQDELLKAGRVVSMAEDSHACDVSRRFGVSMSNLLFFDLVLDAGEYVVDAGGFNVCYVKLAGKPLTYAEGKSIPVTVRWEFSYRDFEDDLCRLAGVWAGEKDVLHSQIYPLRTADYLSRKVSAKGLLYEVAERLRPEPEFRDMREGLFE